MIGRPIGLPRPVTACLAGAFLLALLAPPAALWIADPAPAALLLCHLGHVSGSHALWAGGTTLVLAALCERSLGSRWLLALLLGSALAVGLAVTVLEAGIKITPVTKDLCPSAEKLTTKPCVSSAMIAIGPLNLNTTNIEGALNTE